MYNLNTKQGKESRIKKLQELKLKILNRQKLELDEEIAIANYLEDIKQDLKGQLFMEQVEHYRKQKTE